MKNIIQIEHLYFRPENLPQGQPDILQDIDLAVEEGTFIALLGENGSGKTTLLRHLNGLLLPTSGSILIDGLNPKEPRQLRAIRSRVGLLFQNPADQIVASTVAEDIAFGLENANLPTRDIQAQVNAKLTALDLLQEANRPPHLLSGGQVQRVALAGVLARSPKILLLDEPTSMLDPAAREVFLSQVVKLHEQGLTIILITHHMEEAVLADWLVVLKQGRIAATGSPEEIFTQEKLLRDLNLEMPEALSLSRDLQALGWDLPAPILEPKRLLSNLPDYSHVKSTPLPEITKSSHVESFIQIEDVHYTYLAGNPLAKEALKGASMGVRSGQILGLAGTNGSGKSTLLQHINGILRPHKGTLRIGDLLVSDPSTSLKTIIQQVGLVFQSPEMQFFEEFTGDEIAYGPRQFGMTDLRERVKSAMALVGLDFERYKDRRLHTLSGGEKRKVALASTLVLDQNILLFDEPTAGMDPGARESLLSLFHNLCETGKTLVISSHRLDELAGLAGDFAFMKAGKVTRQGPRQSLLMDQQALAETGLISPFAVQVSQTLIGKGWPLSGWDTTTSDRLISVLQEVIA